MSKSVKKGTVPNLERIVKEIIGKFKPSTTFAEGDLLNTDYEKWSKEIVPKQDVDWVRIKHLLRGTRGKLDWRYRGWIFNECRRAYNWNGWSTNDGIALSMALADQKVKA